MRPYPIRQACVHAKALRVCTCERCYMPSTTSVIYSLPDALIKLNRVSYIIHTCTCISHISSLRPFYMYHHAPPRRSHRGLFSEHCDTMMGEDLHSIVKRKSFQNQRPKPCILLNLTCFIYTTLYTLCTYGRPHGTSWFLPERMKCRNLGAST